MSACRPLPPVAARVDAELARMDGEVDWLLALSPIGNDALWDSFEASGHTETLPLQYIDLDVDLHAARERLRALPVEDIERSEEHTSELQSREKLVCRLLLEIKKHIYTI